MSILIFVIVLAILVLVHEFGHFIIAKKNGIKVSEFGLGFPPKLWGKQKGETLYSVNAIPFGGFVRIFGEDPNEDSLHGVDKERSITAKPRHIQAFVLIGGVFFNVLFAWLLISIGYMVGLPTAQSHTGPGIVENPRLVITTVSPLSPAFRSGVKAGDVVLEVISEGKYSLTEINPQAFSNFVEAHGKDGIALRVLRGKEEKVIEVIAEEGVVQGKLAIGVGLDTIGTLKLPLHLAVYEGGKNTLSLFSVTAVSLVGFLGDAFVGEANFSEVTGPVGIVGLVGDVSKLGFVYLLSFTAIISINLAVINLFPFPALDGGRLIIVLIEAIRRKALSPKILNTINSVGFVVLILLMIVVTFHDVLRVIG